MDETPRKWSSSEVLKVSGVIARQGVFTGHSPDLGTKEHPGFRESAFTPTVLDKITSNFKKPVPIYIDHSYEPSSKRKEVGKSFKLGNSPQRDNISHEGIVWDDAGRQKIENEGYDRISPEIDIEYDTQGNIVDAKVTAVVYVRNPSIGGTGGQVMAMCFDKGLNTPKGDLSMPNEPITPPSGGEQVPPSVPPAQPPTVPAVQPVVQKPVAQTPEPQVHEAQRKVQYVTDPALVAQINELSQKLAQYDAVVPSLIQQNEVMKTQQLAVVAGELKEFGIEAPEALVDGLPVDGKIKALTQLKERLIKTAPMVRMSENVVDIASRAEQDKNAFISALRSLGLTEADYTRVMNGGKINA